ncbi:TBC1 domain family member 2A [Amphiprion ocellaris]|uniref:TBC1 domain family, member 2 n=1 Tax=Amphiprion ocellaris TaxID=80972 RepID=A0AAQ5YTL5_AMPOC|nr:TBC1 domain family member 2A [Amphiprion ocellaris]XP_035806739.2 TBC1 domain family member 2A [Amphiprion ocellaris]
MEGSGSAGNPSAASSRSLPALADEATLQPDGRVSESEDEGKESRESSSLSGSQKHQSPSSEEHQSPSSAQHQSPSSEERQSPSSVEHQSPSSEERQSPSSEERQSPSSEEHQSPSSEEHQSPSSAQHQSPSSVEHQSPSSVEHQSPSSVEHQSPSSEEHQSPSDTQHSEEKPDQPDLTKQTNHQDSQAEKQKAENFPETKKLNTPDSTSSKDKPNPDQPEPESVSPTKLDPVPAGQQKLGGSPLRDKLPSPEPLQSDCLCGDQKNPGSPLGPKQEPGHSQDPADQRDLCLPNPKPEEDPCPPPPSKDLTALSSTLDEQIQKELEFHVSKSKDLQNPQDAPTENLTSTARERDQDHRDPPPLNTQQVPPCADLQNHLCPPTVSVALLTPPLTMEAFCDQVCPDLAVPSSGEPKLCGYLQKQGGPLRAWKQRWFTYEEKKNQLFYYRTPQDVTPLGRVELSGATFTYPLKAEKGTFHIKTPERTFVLKAVTQELMLYWLQQLQVKRWQHRQTSSDPTNNNTTDDFLPVLKSPLGLVGEEAANLSTRTPLSNVSIKHPLIEIQNSVHSLRKRTSQEWSQSVFHVEALPWIPPNAADASNTTSTQAPPAASTPTEPLAPLPALLLADPAGQVCPVEGRESPSLLDGPGRRTKARSMSTMAVLRRDTSSSERSARLQQDKQMLMEEVKAQKELVWILHKALEAAQLEKRTCAEFLAEEGEQERLELLRHRERQAADLRGRLEEAKTEAEAARRSLAQRDVQLAELQDNVRMLTEKNNAKREVIIKLSDQVTACLSEPRRSGSPSGTSLDSQTFKQLQQEMDNLKDDIEAYKTQNKFLNSEIYQLTKLWRKSSEQEKSLLVKCAHLEATNCQAESRYLGVLRKLQEAKSLDPAQREAVQKMIEDALRGELKSVTKLSMDRDHDEYGFKIIPDYEVEDMKLLAKIQALEIRSHNLLHQNAVERPLLSRWAHYLAGRSEHDLCPSPELKVLLRGGIPQEYRQRVWRWMVRARTRSIRERHPQRYQQLCEKSRTSPHPASRQIQLDLHRTLTTNQHFSSPSSPALQQLRRILLAFSWQNPAIGYCQGLNRLAAIALLVLQSEEDAFWCLVTVVEAIMPQDYYTKNLVASQADQRVLKDFMAEKLPRLTAHFEDHSIDVSLITFNWFLVVFVESLPSDILLPLWDAFLYEGTKVIFRYALALFKYKEDDILKIHDSVEIYQYLRFFTKTISDSRRLTSIAFNDMNPFPRRLLRNRRMLHLERLQGELRELEEQQREFVTESAERKDKELDIAVSEDDDEL